MKKMFFMAVVCLLVLPCCQQPEKLPEDYQDQVSAELLNLNKLLWYEAWEKEDLDSCLFFLDKDFLNMFAYGPATGLEENKQSFRDLFENYSVEDVRYERTECLVDSKYATETYWFEQKWITNDKQDTISSKLRGMSVWRKQEDGSWKMFRTMAQQ